MENLICKKCNCNEYYTEKKANNLVARCKNCDSFIKNIATEEPTLYFGKYKGIKISEMKTQLQTQYLHWLLNSDIKLTSNMQNTIKKHLNIN